MSRNSRAYEVTIAALVAATCCVIGWAPPAAAATVTKYLAVDCPQPYSQSCPPRAGLSVTTQGTIAAQFVADPNPPACAPGYVQIFVGHVRVAEGTVWPGNTMKAGPFPFAPGTYDVNVQVDGIKGGCNTGSMSGWSGTLNVQTDADA